MENVLISGANRGIGLQLTGQLIEGGWRVFAGCRQPAKATALQSLAEIHQDQLMVVALDVTDDNSVLAAKTAVSAQTNHLDMLINNAGVLIRDETIDNFDPANMEHTLQVNVIGTMRVTCQFANLLRQGNNAKLVNISSQLGSLQEMKPNWGDYSYNASKAALNMLTRMLSFELQADGVTVVSIHPGWVQTDMGGKEARLTVPDSARGIVEVIDNLTLQDSNKFFTYAGAEHLW